MWNRLNDPVATTAVEGEESRRLAQADHDERPGTAAEWLEAALETIEKQLSRHPRVTLGLGVAAGVFIGWWIKRR